MFETNSIIEFFKNLQDDICHGLEDLDGEGVFREDLWERDGGGGGRTRVIEGRNIEKGGVNFSHVHGKVTPLMRKSMKMEGEQWLASGVSIVLHPVSPMVPIIHMNVRYFELDGGKDWWFGGGIDLTPHYIDLELARKFHQRLKTVCDDFDSEAYTRYKDWADDYFYLPHRGETRGIGGIFFDHLNSSGSEPRNPGGKSGPDKEAIFGFVKNVGRSFLPAYKEQCEQTIPLPYGSPQSTWQMLRRGRYVEFNLIWDRGTKFGLMSDGRTESILMSLPPQANWAYQYQIDPAEDAGAAETRKWLQKGVDWLNQK